jgi:hypothetical protein
MGTFRVWPDNGLRVHFDIRNGVTLIPASRRVSSLRQGGSMYLALAYGLVAFTILVVPWLLWLGWENRRDQVRAERERKLPATISE